MYNNNSGGKKREKLEYLKVTLCLHILSLPGTPKETTGILRLLWFLVKKITDWIHISSQWDCLQTKPADSVTSQGDNSLLYINLVPTGKTKGQLCHRQSSVCFVGHEEDASRRDGLSYLGDVAREGLISCGRMLAPGRPGYATVSTGSKHIILLISVTGWESRCLPQKAGLDGHQLPTGHSLRHFTGRLQTCSFLPQKNKTCSPVSQVIPEIYPIYLAFGVLEIELRALHWTPFPD